MENYLVTFEQNGEIKSINITAKDIVDRDRHGFDENSFIGEPYHGQKRKKI